MDELQKLKTELRKRAMEFALIIRPSAAEAVDRAIPNNSDTVIRDATKFYDWLTKDLKDL